MSRALRLGIALALILCPAIAWAHAHLKRSEPTGGSRLTGSPQAIRLWFTERPELSMTAVLVRDSTGREFALAQLVSDSADPLLVSAPVSQPLPPGRYTVAWRTAASDGHPSHGTFSFVVLAKGSGHVVGAVDTIGLGAAPTASSTASESQEESGSASSLSNSLARTLSFVGLLVLIGACVFRTLVLPRVNGIKADLRFRMERRAALLGLTASVLVIIGALARIHLESEMMNAMPGMQAMGMMDMAMHTGWGSALRLEIEASLLAVVSFALAARRLRGAWLVATLLAIGLAITPALAGHAAASPKFTSLMIGTDFLHVLGGASWLGTLLAVMCVGVPLCLTCDGDERWSAVASLVNAFSPIALVSAAVVVASGAIASWVHLARLSALWQTTYGQVLLVKLVLVAITLTIGAYNFRRVQPQLNKEIGSIRLSRSTAIELSFGFLILLVTGFLTGIST